jgi:hypothetical protein
MKNVTSSRRQIVMAVLLGLATVGAAMRYWAKDPSVWHDIGTLLLVLWLPAVGNLVGFAIRKLPRRAPAKTDFAAGSAFVPHLRAELTPLPAASALDDAFERRCTLVVGGQGFTARLALPLSQWLAAGTMQSLELELLRPALAQRHLLPDTAFRVVAGTAVIGKGHVTGKTATPESAYEIAA